LEFFTFDSPKGKVPTRLFLQPEKMQDYKIKELLQPQNMTTDRKTK